MRKLVTLATTFGLFISGFALAEDPAPEKLWQAAREGNAARVRSLLEAGVPVDAKTEFDCTALYFAANANQPEVMRLLIDAGADISVADNSYGFTAMGMAAWLGHREAVEVLLDAGIEGDDAIGGFFAAASNDHADTVELFLTREMIPPPMRDSAYAMAVNGELEAVAALLEKAGARMPESRAQGGDGGGDSSELPAVVEGPDPSSLDPAIDRPVEIETPGNWPEFRGSGRTGIADGQHPPLLWDLETGHNVAWRTPVEGLGLSSPVIWGNRIFVTTAISPETEQSVDDDGRGWIAAVEENSEHRFELHAYDLTSGELLWRRVAKTGVPVSMRHWKASQANPSCATDGEIVVASFGSEGLYAFDLEGELLWSKDLGELNAGWYVDASFEWGFASSPILYDGMVFVQGDIHGPSFGGKLAALPDKASRWKTKLRSSL